jgi:nondiscriminating glutamyl-tRNA synthetase
MENIRVRFAPSPTGQLHIGGLRTALMNFLMLKKYGGDFVLRIEDTDQKRFVPGAVKNLIDALHWAGIEYTEGVFLKETISDKNYAEAKDYPEVAEVGTFGPYIQSERLGLYKKYVQQLLDEEKAYYCFCSSERLQDLRHQQEAQKQAPRYDRACLELSKEAVAEKLKNGEPYVVRFKIPAGQTKFQDLVYGEIVVENSTLDDQVILKSDGFPTYHLAVVVDDYLMKITHTIRGTEWLPSAPKHVLLYEALNWRDAMPVFLHMPNVLNKEKKKLSKREGSVSVEDFRKLGYPKEALLNFIALLGWNPKTEQEIFTLPELIEQFEINKINKAGGVFDLDRLDWISAQHIKKMDLDTLYKNSLPFFAEKDFYQNAPDEKKNETYLKKVLTIEQERLHKFSEVGEENKFFFRSDLNYSLDDIRWKKSTDAETKKSLADALLVLENISENEWEKDLIEKNLLAKAGTKRGDLLFPLRWVLTGQKYSPSPFETAWVLGKEETLRRIGKALSSIQ